MELPRPQSPPSEWAGQALSLATRQGEEYHRQVVHILLEEDGLRLGEEVITRGAEDAHRLAQGLRAAGRVSQQDLTELEVLWSRVGRQLADLATDPHVRSRILALHGLRQPNTRD